MRYRTLLCAALLAWGTVAAPALAQPTQAEIEASKKAAAEAANKAFDDFKDGKYDDAIAGFQKADKAFHALKFVLYVARAQVKQSKLLAAKATYEAIVKEQLPAYAPPEFFAAQTDAKKELAELTPRIPTLTIQVKGGIGSVTLDGQPVTLGQTVTLDPGEHTIAGVAPDQRWVSTKLTLQAGDAKTETLEPPPPVARLPTGIPTASATAAPTTSAPPRATSTIVPVLPTAVPTATSSAPAPPRSVPIATYLAYSVGGASLIAGVVLGGLTVSTRGKFDAHATTALANEGESYAIAADIALSAALIGVVAGTVVWLAPPSDPQSKKSARSVFVAPGLGGVTIGGKF